MSTVTRDNFGPLIAYLVPGATVLWGLSLFSPALRLQFLTSTPGGPSLGDVLYLTVASLAVGMVVSAVRWTVVDQLHRLTGISLPDLDFSRLGKNVEAFNLLIAIHYIHYQFYANMFIATAIAYGCYRVKNGGQWPLGPVDVAFACLEIVFFVTSRDTLKKYYVRSQELLRRTTKPVNADLSAADQARK